jgi:hypothetical protein
MSHDPGDLFDTTRWSLVAAAGDSDPSVARGAREQLCASYWRPIFVCTRGFGYGTDAALDVTQGFFARLLERKDFEHARREHGPLSALLLAALRHYHLNEAVHRSALKRGGGRTFLSIDALEVERLEAQYARHFADHRTPESLFARQWALDVVHQVQARLRAEWQAAGKAEEFELLKDCLEEKLPRGSYGPLAARLGRTENAARIAAHRLRQGFREELRATVADALPPDARDDAAIERQLRHLFDALLS